jgi:alpha-tubulin suppressor-like RCC1 family protein
MVKRTVLVLITMLAGCSVDFEHGDGTLQCGPDGLCPDGYLCKSVPNVCVLVGERGASNMGDACTDGSQCQSGACTDGVCCDNLCDGSCETCNAPGTAGHCVAVTGAAAPNKTACSGGNGVCASTCDGVDRNCTFPTVECSPAGCVGTQELGASTCQNGTCPAQPVVKDCTATVDTKICGATTCAGIVDAIAADTHVFVILSDGSVKSWGNNYKGGIGDPDPTHESAFIRKPFLIPGLTGVKKIISSPYMYHECAVMNDTRLLCWGDNRYAQLGIGSQDDIPHPVPSPVLKSDGTPLTGVMDVSGTTYSTCALLTDGSLQCWGRGIDGRVGDGDASDHYVLHPTVAGTAGSFVGLQIAGGEDHTCLSQRSGSMTVICWGDNSFLECGQPSTVAKVTTPTVDGGWGGMLDYNRPHELAGGSGFNLGVDAGGNLYCWGNGYNGQCGRGGTGDTGYQNPVPVCKNNVACAVGSTDALPPVTDFAAGEVHACAIASNQVYCWGGDNYGQLGNMAFGEYDWAIAGPAFPIAPTQITAGQRFTCVVLADRTLRCWGRNTYGELGIAATDDYELMPVSPDW